MLRWTAAVNRPAMTAAPAGCYASLDLQITEAGMRDLMSFVNIDTRAAGSIAVGMRKMAQADGQEHPRELEMIALLESDLPLAPTTTSEVDLAAFHSRDLQDTFLKSLALVALVDGALKSSESELIHRYGRGMGLTEDDVAVVLQDVAEVMLSAFAGVTVFREQALQIGKALGLSDDSIARVLDGEH